MCPRDLEQLGMLTEESTSVTVPHEPLYSTVCRLSRGSYTDFILNFDVCEWFEKRQTTKSSVSGLVLLWESSAGLFVERTNGDIG